jgi:N-acetyl-anhydromuramyl-L-alanine amidase AmpD
MFIQAANEFGVPADLLRSIAFVESRWTNHVPDVAEEGAVPPAYGVMGLRDDDWFGHSLRDAAAMIGRTPEELKSDPELNIRGTAALLAILGRGATSLEEWEAAVAKLSGIPQDEVARIYTYDVFNSLRTGRASDDYSVRAHDVDLEKIYGRQFLQQLSAPMVTVQSGRIASESSDYGPALWNPAASCNYTLGRTMAVTHVTIHTAEGSYAGTISWFQNCSAQVSAHYVVGREGQVLQMVHDQDVAWHAGRSAMRPELPDGDPKKEPNVNAFSIGIELVGTHDSGFTDKQLATLYSLLEVLVTRYRITPERVVGHCQIAPGRKTDPDGYNHQFNWAKARSVSQVAYSAVTNPGAAPVNG